MNDSTRPDPALPTRRVLLRAGMVAGVAVIWHPRRGFARSKAIARRHEDGLPAELVAAVARGDRAIVRRHVEENKQLLVARDEAGRSLLVLAFLAGHPEIGHDLAQLGAPVDLVESVLLEDVDRQKQLLTAGADPNALHPIGGTAYYAAAHFGRVKAMWPLNRHGGDPNLAPEGGTGITAARAAFEHPDPEIVEAAVLRIITDAGDVRAEQRDGDSILHAAARFGNPSLVRTIVRMGGDVNARNASGHTPLQVAEVHGRKDAIAVLRGEAEIPRQTDSSRFAYDANGAPYRPPEIRLDQEIVNEFGEVCHYRFERLTEIAAQHPEVVHARASWDELGVEACAHMGQPAWTEHLLALGAPMSLPTALAVGNLERVHTLLEDDPGRIHERGPHDFALLWYPQIAGGRVDLAECLLNYGADIDEEKMGVTLLHRAAHSGQRELVGFLLDQGARTDLIGQSDFSDLAGTPLDFARAGGHSDIARMIRQQG